MLPPGRGSGLWLAIGAVRRLRSVDEADAIQRSWLEAAADLGIEVEPVGDGVLVANFGSGAGMLCALRRTAPAWQALRRAAEARGAGWSALGHSYLSYDRDLFIETLSDWGWFGEGPPPDWLPTGR